MYKVNTYARIFTGLALIFIGNFSYAQLGFCGGNSGDPIFTETFGTGTSYGPPLPAGTTTYAYVGFGGPQDGQYTVGSSTFEYGWNMPTDHTPGDTNGKALIVNASFTSGEFYATAINGLCENTTYEFSSWVLNILPSSGCAGNGNPVNLSFEIWDSSNTILLASGNTGDIPSTTTPIWGKYGLVFTTTPGQFSVILKMKNNGIGGCGNDLAIDDIVFKTCGDFVLIEDSNSNTSVSLCTAEIPYNSILQAIPDFSVFNSHFYQWQQSLDGINWTDITGETNQTYQVSNINIASYYRVKVAESAINLANSSCNTISEVFEITISPDVNPPISDGNSLFNCDINQGILSVTVPTGISVDWYDAPSNGNLLQSDNTVYFTTNETGTFYAEAIDSSTGCKSQSRTAVSVSRLNPTEPISDGDVFFNCIDQQAELSVTAPSSSTIDWYDAPIAGTLLQSNSSTYLTTLSNGTFYAQTKDSATGCVSENRTPVSVSSVFPNPPLSNGNSVFNCINNESIISVSVPNGISVNWYDDNGNLLESGSVTYTAITPGSYFAEAIIINTGCASINRTEIIVEILYPNTPISAGDAEFNCQTNEAFLSVNVANDETANWYDSNGNLVLSGNTFFTATVAGLYFAEAVSLNSGCVSLNTVMVEAISINPDPPISNGDINVSCNTSSGTLSVSAPSGVSVNWYDSETGGNILQSNSLTYETNIPGTYFAEAIDNISSCESLIRTPVSLIPGQEFPIVEDEDLFFCEGDMVLLDAGISNVTYLWSTGEITRQIIVDLEGIYTVTVTDINNCSSIKTIELTQINEPQIESIQSNGFQLEIFTTETGNYEYSLDDTNYQMSNIFNVEGGLYTVYVRGIDGCGIVSADYIHFVIPKFFTPNNDGQNDIFLLKGIELYSESEVYIFDRYGKLLKSSKNQPFSWDGTFNNEVLITSDYWYFIKIEDQIFKGHFTLKR